MSDWRTEIKEIVDEHLKLKKGANKIISEVLNELRVSPYGYETHFVQKHVKPLEWDIDIKIDDVGTFRYSIDIRDFADEKKNEYGEVVSYFITDDHQKYKDKIRNIIVTKIKDDLAY